MLATTIVFAALVATAQEPEEKWESYTSKPLGYTVTRPVDNDQEASIPNLGPTGMINQTEIIRQPGGVQYWIILMESNSEIPKADETKWFDFARKTAGERAGATAKVISDKPVQVGPASGRDFELKVERGGSTAHLKGRTFIRGTTAYTALAISSTPGQDVDPAKAERFLKSFAPVERSGAVAAKPANGGGMPGLGFNIQTKKTVTRSGGPTTAKGAGGWEALTYREDGFTVQMPHRPESDETEGAGGFQVHTVTCETDSMTLLAVAVKGPSDVPEGQQSPALERLMGKAVEKIGTNFGVGRNELNEFEPVHVRKFDIHVERPMVGQVAGEARGFVKGNRVFLAIALSKAKGDEVPEDGTKFVDSFALIGGTGGASTKSGPARKAAPRPNGFNPGMQPPPGRWVEVSSLPDSYRLEMPGFPNGDENESAGGFSVSTRSFQSPAIDYLITVVRGPSDVPKEQEAMALARFRDQVIGKFGKDLKVVGDRPTKAGAFEGREYAMTLDRISVGKVYARSRAFVRGDRIYMATAIGGQKEKDLPSDVVRFLDSFAITAAAPSPSMARKESSPAKAIAKDRTPRDRNAKSSKEWGKEVDPDGDVKIQMTAKELKMTIPGTPHVLAPERNIMNAPRVVSPTDGDFELNVQVDGKFNPSDRSTVKGLSSRQAAGLILWKDASNYLVFQRRASAGEEKDTNAAVLEELVAGKKGVTHRQAAAEGPISLRLEREGGKITASFSTNDGKTWKELKPVDTTWAEGEILVGVIAVSTSTGPHAVTFEDFSLESK